MLEYYSYYSASTNLKCTCKSDREVMTMGKIKDQLPRSVANELLEAPYSLCVESGKLDVVQYLDDFLVKKRGFGKNRHIEVTRDEIVNYDYFLMDVASYNWGQQVFFEFNKPTCSHETCPWGFMVTSAVEISSTIVSAFDIARAFSIWDMTIRLIITRTIKELFEEKEITGLEYSECRVRNNDKYTSNADKAFYVAEITKSYCRKADRVNLRDYCKRHSFALDCQGVSISYPIQELTSSDDFQVIDKLRVDRKVYSMRPWFFLSRKALQVLMGVGARGLKSMSQFTKGGITPVPFD
jgi:hypothetical protein